MGAWKKAMNYLGLGPDDAYDDYDPSMENDRSGRSGRPSYGPDMDSGTVRTVPARTGGQPREQGNARSVNPPDFDAPQVAPRPRSGSAVRTVSSTSTKPYTVRPRRFDQAQEVADKFKQDIPVIVNLQDVEKDLQRRIIDFCAGLTYGLDGAMEKAATGVYLLTPANVSVSAEDKRLMGERDVD